MASKKTVVATGASQGIGAAVVQTFLARGYNVVASRSVSKAAFAKLPNLAVVDGDIGQGGACPVDRRTPSDERSRAFLR